MSRDSAGDFTLAAGNPVVTATAIDSTVHNNTLSDLASEITDSLSRSGKGGMTAVLKGVDGAVGTPAFSFTNDPDTGLFLLGTNLLGFTTGGVQRVQLNSLGLKSAAPIHAQNGAGVDLSNDACALVVADSTGQHIEMDDSEIQSKSNETTAAALAIQRLGGNLNLGAQSGTGTTQLFHDGSGVFVSTALGGSFVGNGTNGQVAIDANGAGAAILVVKNTEGSFRIEADGDAVNFKLADADGSSNAEFLMRAVGDGQLTWYHNGLAVGNTVVGGVDITGTLDASVDVQIGGFSVALANVDIIAGVGLSGGGVISEDRTLTLDLDELGVETTIAAGDFVAMVDITDSGSQKITFTNFIANIDHDGLNNFVADEHVAHSGVTITAGNGLAGGGSIESNLSLIVDLDELSTAVGIDAGDFVAFVDITDSGSGKITFANFEGALNHDALTGFVADEHVAHAGISVVAGAGMTGGGTIDGSVTLNAIAGDGITVNADDIDLDISGLGEMTVVPVTTDDFLYLDGAVHKKINWNQFAFPSANDADDRTFVDTDVSQIIYYTGTGGHTFTMPTGIGQDDCCIAIINSGSAALTVAGSGVTINSPNGLLDVTINGLAVLTRETSTVWFLNGALE